MEDVSVGVLSFMLVRFVWCTFRRVVGCDVGKAQMLTPVQGKNCLTSFYGMDFTTDKLRSIVRKWQTLIEASVDVRTTDGYVLRLFAIGFTKRALNQVKKTTYAKSSQIREIRAKMTEIMRREAEGSELKELVQKFVPESIGREIEKACKVGLYPVNLCFDLHTDER